MYLNADLGTKGGADQRRAVRYPVNVMGIVRQQRRHNDTVHLVDISTGGCGFRAAWQLFAGTQVWLALPGIETWPATVAWFEEGKGGLSFENPLQPQIAESFATSLPGRSSSAEGAPGNA